MIGNIFSTLLTSFLLLTGTSTTTTCDLDPVIYGVEDIHYEIGSGPVEYFDGVTAVSGCDENIDLTERLVVNDRLVELEQEGRYIISYNVLSPEGKTTTQTAELFVHYDITKPVISGHENLTIEIMTSEIDYLKNITVTDNKDSQVSNTLVVDDSNVDLTKVGTYSLRYTATDESGNTAVEVVELTVVDTQKPTIEGTSDLTFEVGSNLNDYNFFEGITITDNSTKLKSSEVILDEVNINQLGTYNFKYVVYDEANNKTEVTKKITVVDTTKPILTIEEEIYLDLYSDKFPDYRSFIEVSDNYDDLTYLDVSVIDRNVNLSKPGKYQIYYFVSDSSGNYTLLSTYVNIYDDDLPIIENVKDLEVQLNQTDIDYYHDITVHDFTDGDLLDDLVIYNQNVDVTRVGRYKIYYVIYDSSNNLALEEATVIVYDSEKPRFQGIEDKTIEVFSEDVNLLDGISAIDDHDGDVTERVTVSHNINFNELGSYIVTLTVSDQSNNESSETFTVHIVDSTKPELVNIKDLQVKVGETIDLLKDMKAIDNVDGDITDSIVLKGDYNFNKVGTYELKAEVTDSSGNITYQYFNLEVVEEITDQKPENNSDFLDNRVIYIVSLMVVTVVISIGVRYASKRFKK